jgi:4-hydroxy-2-oxoglutarate aldolase
MLTKLTGIFAALATPFDYKGDIYKAKVQHNVEKWNKTALAGYAVCTKTGEGPLLMFDEKAAVWEMVAQWAAPGRTLIADVSAEGVRESAALARRAHELGYHAVLCDMPRAYGDAPASLYCRALADQCPLPLVVRDAPELPAHPNIAAILDTGVPREAANVQRLTASAAHLWASLKSGAAGAILASASADPFAAVLVWEAFRTREEEAGIDWQSRIADPQSIHALKSAMDVAGYYGGPPRLPLS